MRQGFRCTCDQRGRDSWQRVLETTTHRPWGRSSGTSEPACRANGPPGYHHPPSPDVARFARGTAETAVLPDEGYYLPGEYPIPVTEIIRVKLMENPPQRDPFLLAAIDEARRGLAEGGIPIGSVLVLDGRIVGRGHNRRVQRGSPILHAEMDAFEDAGRLKAADYRRAVLYSTLSPCDMCSGTALLYRIPRIVVGENQTFRGPEEYLRSRGVVLEVLDDPECVRLMEEFIRTRPELWHEDIGE